MNTNQEICDVCLIKTWRNAGMVLDAVQMYRSITKADIHDHELLRKPKIGYPYKTGIRVFVASFLPKISERLWDQKPEKDIDLFRALKNSKYTTQEKAVRMKQEFANLYEQTKRNTSRINAESHFYDNRNRATDWNVTKGKTKTKAAR